METFHHVFSPTVNRYPVDPPQPETTLTRSTKNHFSPPPVSTHFREWEPATSISGFKHVEFSKFANATVCRSM